MLQFRKTKKIGQLLHSAIRSTIIDSTLKHQAQEHINGEKVPFRLIQDLCKALRADREDGPWVHEVCSGTEVILTPPVERNRSPELLARLQKLQNQVDEDAYQKMVGSVAKRDEEDNSFNLLPSFRLQLSFGAHVLITMFVFYLLGSYGMRAFSDRPTIQALGGVLGLSVALILETTLFILRSFPLKDFSTSVPIPSKQKQC